MPRLVRIAFAAFAAFAAFVVLAPLTPPLAAQSRDATEQKKECTVYVTKSGKRYHRTGCSSLRRSRIALIRREAVRRGYTPCKGCGGSSCEQ
jgi:hypothetical protein